MKKVILIVVPVILLLAGGVVFAAFQGMINIPGLTPKKKPKAPGVAIYADKPDDKVPEKPKKKPEKKPEKKPDPPAVAVKPPPDLIAGAKKVAKVWNELTPAQVSAIILKDWKTPDIARVLMLMEGEKTAGVLAALDPAKASEISKEIQKQGSLAVK